MQPRLQNLDDSEINIGLVTCMQSGFYTVQTDNGAVTCRLRGHLKKGPIRGDIIAVGDQVKITRLGDGTGVIEEVYPREHALVRMAPTPRGVYQQVLLANLDQIVLVFACTQPEPRLRMLDRFLVISEKQDIPSLIVANKVDLVTVEHAQEVFSIYPTIGYSLVITSALSGYGMMKLERYLRGKTSGLVGPSGVGKSSLLNYIQPHLGLEVKRVSKATSKGRHATVVRQMFALDGGGYVADLPGLKSLALWDMEPEELDGYFPEIRPLVAKCQFSDCAHMREPGCAVRAAVIEGSVHPERYESYLRLRAGEDWG